MRLLPLLSQVEYSPDKAWLEEFLHATFPRLPQFDPPGNNSSPRGHPAEWLIIMHTKQPGPCSPGSSGMPCQATPCGVPHVGD